MTPGDTLTLTPPLPTPRTPLFRRGRREVVHRLRGGFYNAFLGPPPDGGASRRMRWHRGDPRRSRPLMGSRPRPTPEGEGGDG